jgi:hypothetical protein
MVKPSYLVSSTASTESGNYWWGLEHREWFVPNTMFLVLEMFPFQNTLQLFKGFSDFISCGCWCINGWISVHGYILCLMPDHW